MHVGWGGGTWGGHSNPDYQMLLAEGTDGIRIAEAIGRTEQFFSQLGLATRLSQLNIGEDTIAEIERRFNERGTLLGECRNINGTVARAILECQL